MDDSQKLRAARLRAARQEAGYSKASDFVRALNIDREVIPEVTYRSYENGNRALTFESAKALASALGVDPMWLMEGTKPSRGAKTVKRPREPETISAIGGAMMGAWTPDLPVRGMAECGPDGWSWLNGEQIELTDRPPYLAGAAKAFAVYIQGDSMRPGLPQGALAYIHPGKPIGIGDYVLIELKPEPGESTPRALIKLLVRRSGTKVTLEQLNPPKTIEVKSAEIEHIYKVVGVAFR